MLAYTNRNELYPMRARHRLQVNAASPGSENATQSVFNPTLIPMKVINQTLFLSSEIVEPNRTKYHKYTRNSLVLNILTVEHTIKAKRC